MALSAFARNTVIVVARTPEKGMTVEGRNADAEELWRKYYATMRASHFPTFDDFKSFIEVADAAARLERTSDGQA
jgi:hypothetical protein